MIKREDVITWLTCYRQVIKDNKDYLTELDSAIGDADHGANMDRGFNAVVAKLPSVEEKDIGTILKTAGMTLVSTVGGAGGPLYGTFFMRAGMAVDGKAELTPEELAGAFDAGVAGVQQRGKATLGEKTMLDSLTPACQALHESLDRGNDLKVSLDAAAAAAEQGMKDTIPMLATKGRASYLGERSIGHQDPGATSSFLLVQCAADCFGKD
ncbi:MAG: dihydroxyacetone kinase subunit L [Anaerolineae bacterium]|nr:dihydroxyacetone kinase subunit L [Anaerolineae bacterium]MCB9130554.1 dihydroxyacetone kinase subunit L [Anaerolineales bacterium]MCB0230570.1 dihydroxyacetone kinase subunit L [Anaerolineae bacterium]MCB0232833.1 dihydroxyacetone kinase subunit L [Anaerolineae bacterium]MCB0240709.1 dihydroxyacetone kinase subunit L [Anaerolineae bacterium]